MSSLARIPSHALVFTLLLALGVACGLVPAQAAMAAEAPTWRVLDSTATSVRVELTIPEPERRPLADGSVVLTIPGGAELGADGAPALPTVSRLVAIPAGAHVTGSVLEWSAATLDRIDVAPNRSDDNAPYARDARAYARTGWQAPSFLAGATMLVPREDKADAPAPVVAVGAPAIMAGQTVVPLTVAPVLYDAGRKRAEVCSRVVVELRFETTGTQVAAKERPLTRSFAALAGDQVLNLPREKTLPAAGAQPGLWVAVVRNNATVLAKLQPLIDWRKRQGYSVEVVNADAAGNTTTGIKAALQAIYDDPARPPLEFVVLVGDAPGTATASSIPTWRESMSGYQGEGDHYYGQLDGADILADVHIGRLSFSNSTLSQLDTIVNKILSYEQSPPMDNTDWYGRACLMGDETSSGVTTIWVNQWLKTRLQELGWSHIDTVWSGNFPTQMTASLTPGASVFTYRGYLGMSGIGSGNISTLTNGGRLPVALLPTCDSGSFSSSSEARSEAWLRASAGGGIAAVGTATTGTHTRYNNAYFMGAWDGLLHGSDHRVGAGHTAGKVGLYTNYFVGEPDRAEIWAVWNNLMGDPATDMWIGVPRALDVTAPATLASGAGTIAVTVMSGPVPVSGALVCAADAGGECLRGVTDYQGKVTLTGKPPVNGSLKLTVSGHGLLPYLGNIVVGPAATFCGLTGTQYIDDGTLGSAGNGDGQPSPGETVAVLPTLTNSGTSAATGVTAVLSGGAPWATMTGGSLDFGNLDATQSAAAAQPALVTLAAAAPAGQVVPLTLVATDGSQSWTSTLELEVKAPRFAVTGLTFGGPGGICDPGETGTLAVTLRNEGSLAATGVTATLTTTSPWLAITDPSGAFPGVAPGATTTNAAQTFSVYANTDCFAGHLAVCRLVLTSNGVMLSESEFTLTVGTQVTSSPSGPDRYGYYAFDDTDIASGLAPVYNWVGIAPDEGGSGVDVGLTDFAWEQDDTRTVDLPFSFRYYGKDFSRLSICSNGWVAMGECSLISYHNQGIPGAAGTPGGLIAPFWDNLTQSGTNRVYHWYDDVQHRYIIEWHQLQQNYETYQGSTEDFQLILLDPLFHQTTSGEGMLIFQYKVVNDDDDRNAYATVGIQNPEGDDGILYSYWNHIMGGAAPLQTGRAILFMPLGELVLPAMQVTPASVVAGAVPGGQASREVQISNLGDAGSLLQVFVAAVDPLLAAGKGLAGSGGVTPLSIAGSTMTLDATDYEAGSTVDLHVTVGAVTAGSEWILDLTLDAPPGVIVNSSTSMTGGNNPIASTNATGDGATVFWDGSNSAFLNNGNTGQATVNVTFAPTLQGNAVFTWTMQGDIYGAPPHDLTGTITLVSRGPSIFVTSPATAAVAVLGQPLTVQFAALNGPTQVSVELQREVAGPWEMLVASTPAAGGSWTWPAVTGAPGPYAQLRVRDVADPLVEGLSGVFMVSRDLSWLQPQALSLVVPAGATEPLSLTLDATGLAEGVYEALLVIAGNGGAPVSVPVTFTVAGASAVDDEPLPAALALLGARPNPFNPRTAIRFAMPAAQDARLDVFTVRGQLVRRLLDGRVGAGVHDIEWDGRDDAGHDAASGVYFYRLRSGDEALTGKMILAR